MAGPGVLTLRPGSRGHPPQGAQRQDLHEDAGGNFSYHAVGRALSRRWFNWRGVTVQRRSNGAADPVATVNAAFAPVATMSGEEPILGVFVHHGTITRQ